MKTQRLRSLIRRTESGDLEAKRSLYAWTSQCLRENQVMHECVRVWLAKVCEERAARLYLQCVREGKVT